MGSALPLARQINHPACVPQNTSIIMARYTVVTFAPVQGFIEKSRKLRDLEGASLILSYLSRELAKAAKSSSYGMELVSPGFASYTKGMPNRLLFVGQFDCDREQAEIKAKNHLIEAWKAILDASQNYLENWMTETLSKDEKFKWVRKIQTDRGEQYPWYREWNKWKNHSWEVFLGMGDTPKEAQRSLEERKLSRRWTAINWIGESSSLSGVDAIAYPRLEAPDIQPDKDPVNKELELAEAFFEKLSEKFGKDTGLIDSNERLSIPELVKRLVLLRKEDNQESIVNNGIQVPKSFKEIVRNTKNNPGYEHYPNHWTGWFMGDGDKFGDRLNDLANRDKSNEGIEKDLQNFSKIVRQWSIGLDKKLKQLSTADQEPVRVIYSGGDDFLGVIYSNDPCKPIPGYVGIEWLKTLYNSWKNEVQTNIEYNDLIVINEKEKQPKKLTFSTGFIWAGASVPQRDVLQHCREAEKRSKNLGRDRVTLRVVFNNGQFVEWTAPWDYLDIFDAYKDLEGQSGANANWNHIYSDLAHLRSRHAFGLGFNLEYLSNRDCDEWQDNLLNFFELYFPSNDWKQRIKQESYTTLFPNTLDKYQHTILWIESLILVGWHLMRDRWVNTPENDSKESSNVTK